MKNLLMFLLSFSLITTSQISFGNNGDNNDCCAKMDTIIIVTDLSNENELNILTTDYDNSDTSDHSKRRNIEAVMPLYDLSLSNFVVAPEPKGESTTRVIDELVPLYDLSLSNFSVNQFEEAKVNSLKVVEVNPVYDLSLTNFAVHSNLEIDLKIPSVK